MNGKGGETESAKKKAESSLENEGAIRRKKK